MHIYGGPLFKCSCPGKVYIPTKTIKTLFCLGDHRLLLQHHNVYANKLLTKLINKMNTFLNDEIKTSSINSDNHIHMFLSSTECP